MSSSDKSVTDDRRLDWKSLLLVLILLPVLVLMGFWQLQRAEEKRLILAEYEARQAQAPQWLSGLAEVENYQPVMLRGHYDSERYWLLDNRIDRGRFGFEVVALLNLASGEQVLVNRGWVAGDPGRRSLPEVVLPEGEQIVTGEVYYPRGGALNLSTAVDAASWPRLQQWLDMAQLRREFGQALRPFTVRVHRSGEAVVNVTPAKHTGYAVQWFGMALVLVLFFIWRNSRLFDRRRRIQQ